MKARRYSRKINAYSMVAPMFAAGIFASALSAPASAQGIADDIASMISGGTAKVAMRYRFEDVEQDNALDDATASTLRTRLTLQSATVNKFSVLFEADNILTLGADDYDSFQLNKYRGNHSLIADPVGTEINQSSVKYMIAEGASATLGRQRINHAAQRFVGSVGWRQNEQTMDAYSYNRVAGKFSIDYSYLWNVNRIFKGSKASAQVTDFDSDSHALLLSSKENWGTLSGFLYALDFSNGVGASSVTYGLSYGGTVAGFALNATFAGQSDYGDNPLSYDTEYLALDIGKKLGSLNFVMGYEQLGSDDGVAGFSTPLATLHKFQGFADMFLNTPAKGIEDIYVTVGTTVNKFALSATYHDFDADEGSADYGSELDVVIGYTVSPKVNFEAKYAAYDSDGFAVDTDKLWLTMNLAF